MIQVDFIKTNKLRTKLLFYINRSSMVGRLDDTFKQLEEKVDTDTDDALFNEKNYDGILICNCDQVVGYLLTYSVYSFYKGKILFIHNFFIDRGSQGKGIGKFTLKHLAKVCIKEGYKSIDWNGRLRESSFSEYLNRINQYVEFYWSTNMKKAGS